MRTVVARVMHQIVHVLAEQVIGVVVSQRFHTRSIAEGAVSLKIETVDRFNCRIEYQANLLLARSQGIFNQHPIASFALQLGVCPLQVSRAILHPQFQFVMNSEQGLFRPQHRQ